MIHHLLKEKSGRSPAKNFSPRYTSSRAGATPQQNQSVKICFGLSSLYE
ncbi:MAG: hypothetical protein IV298_14120 [Cylindrospermopsis raciborskii KL1]|nr:hypothetical protein [Cylindrospermopsis raciborskii]MBG0744593.1 hypothetical protein [Cylindrospermopsis raciborskii KL1]